MRPGEAIPVRESFLVPSGTKESASAFPRENGIEIRRSCWKGGDGSAGPMRGVVRGLDEEMRGRTRLEAASGPRGSVD